MKKSIITLAILLFSTFSLKSQSPEPPDTIKILSKPEKVTVSRNGDITTIEVISSDEYGRDRLSYEIKIEASDESEPTLDFEIPFGIGSRKESKSGTSRKRKLQTSTFVFGNMYIGQRFNYSDKGNVKTSIECGIRNLIGLRWSHGAYTPSFSIGVGFGVQKYKAQDGFVYAKEESKILLVPVDTEVDRCSTGMDVFNFQIPLLFTLPIGCDVEFVAGAVGCFNTYAKAKTEYEVDRSKYKSTYKGLQQRLFTAELTASLGVCNILGVYASWSPMTLFDAQYGPQLKSWSIGAIINF